MNPTLTSNTDNAEVAKFDRLANRWWDPEGEFKPLHKLNPLRANFIDEHAPVAEKRLLDIGCGGGLLSEAMAQRGALVKGIDKAQQALEVARMHAKAGGLSIDYQENTAEALAAQEKQNYQIVTCLELLEHLPDPSAMVRNCAQLVQPGGSVFFSTLNRTPKAYALAVLGAEYVLNWLPRGTHDYRRFIRPSELAAWCRDAGLQLQQIRGFIYHPLTGQFSLSERDVDVNYIVHCQKLA